MSNSSFEDMIFGEGGKPQRRAFVPRPIPPADRRELRAQALNNAAYLHCDADEMFDREHRIAEVLKTAQDFYDWICKEDDI